LEFSSIATSNRRSQSKTFVLFFFLVFNFSQLSFQLHLIPDKTKDYKDKNEKEKADREKAEKELWWRKQPNWWYAVDEAQEKKKKDEEKEKEKKNDWWKGTNYKGKVFLPLSNDNEKVNLHFLRVYFVDFD
jgi:hypothetical protein